MDKQNFNDLIKKAKASNQPKVIQKIVPIPVKESKEVQFSFYLDKNLLKRIKLKALNEEKSIKNIINEALENFLEKN